MKILCALLLLSLSSACLASSLDGGPTNRTIQSRTLVEAYAKNPIAADQMYRGKVYTVAGKVEKIVSDETVYLELEVQGVPTDKGVWWLRCLFANTAGLASVQAGTTVSVTGTIDGLRNTRLILKDCFLPR